MHETISPASTKARRATLLIGGILTGVIALSMHVFVLAALNIPTPQSRPSTGVLAWLSSVGTMIGIVLLCRYTSDALRQRGAGALRACLTTFVLFAMFSESLIRMPLMNGVVSQSFAYPVIAGLIGLLPLLAIFALSALVSARVRDPRWLVLAGVAVWACFKYVLGAPLKAITTAVMTHAASLARQEVYSPPYDWHVYIPAYISYAEPVVGVFLLLGLMWDRLPGRTGYRCALVVLIFLLAKNLAVSPFAYALAAPPGSRLVALVSIGQFSVESAVLVLCAIATRTVADAMARRRCV